MKKVLVCLLLSAASVAHAHNPHRHHKYHNHHNHHNWAPIVAGAVVGAILTRPGVVYSQPVPVQSYQLPAAVPQVSYGTYYNYTPSCRYAEARDYYGNITPFLHCN